MVFGEKVVVFVNFSDLVYLLMLIFMMCWIDGCFVLCKMCIFVYGLIDLEFCGVDEMMFEVMMVDSLFLDVFSCYYWFL